MNRGIRWGDAALHDPIDSSEPSSLKLGRCIELIRLLPAAPDQDIALQVLLAGAMSLQTSDFGNVQILSADRRSLSIAVQHGFNSNFLQTFRSVAVGDGSVCGRAMQKRGSVAVSDVHEDPLFAPYREVAEDAGFRAVHSTPLVALDGEFLGVVSTHFAHRRQPSPAESLLIDEFATLAAEVVQRFRGVNGEQDMTAPRHLHRAKICREMGAMSLSRQLRSAWWELRQYHLERASLKERPQN